ncbi:MAG: PilZ domain-containing protein [Planctomycetota bacterium]
MNTTEPMNESSRAERREHRRIDLHMPVACRREREGLTTVLRTNTRNVSSGGFYIEVDSPDFTVGERLGVELTVPPGQGVSPYTGLASCKVEVVRFAPLDDRKKETRRRYGLAARFLDPLRIAY